MFSLSYVILLIFISTSILAIEAVLTDPGISENELYSDVKRLRPKLNVVLQKEGLHKILDYSLDFDHYLAGCDLTLKQDFPAALYVDTDELKGLMSRNDHNITFPDFVDIEKPTESSKGFSILLHSEMKKYHTSIPVHFRYHSPGDDQFVKVEIDVPKIYINCPDWSVADMGECFDEAKTLSRKCGWIQAQVVVLEKMQLTANIPRGDQSIGVLVSFLTVGVSWIGCIVVVFSISAKIRKKDVKKLQ